MANQIITPIFMDPSGKWLSWKAKVDFKTCDKCRKKNGKIYDIGIPIDEKPPLHFYCRCIISILQAIMAGTATEQGRNGADWTILHLRKLPNNYVTKTFARASGWNDNKGNLREVLPGMTIGGDPYRNDDGKLPAVNGRIWYEADINYTGGYRNSARILFSNDGLVFVSYDHYQTFYEVL